MFKIDKIKHLYNCSQCNQLLVEPVTIPCGYSVCKRHLDEQLSRKTNEESTFQCGICLVEHCVPREGFVINKLIQDGLDIKLNILKLSPVFEGCRKEIEEAQEKVSKIETLAKDPENHIFEYFQKIKGQIDLRREELKMKIDEYSDGIMQSIESAEANCIKLSKEVKRLTSEIVSSKNELDLLVKRFDTFDIDEKKLEEIRQKVAVLNHGFREIFDSHSDSLIGNKKYSFKYEDLPIEDVFGSLKITKGFDSAILDEDLQDQLVYLCEFSNEQNWMLQYRATRDGFSSNAFHSKCDGISNTLTVIKSAHGNIFGGFTEKAWGSKNAYATDPNAFIFSLINQDKNKFKVVCSNNGDHAIGCHLNCGPLFGGVNNSAKDIGIIGDSNTNEISYCKFGHSYKHPNYITGTEKSQFNLIAGSEKFQTVEIEIFIKKD